FLGLASLCLVGCIMLAAGWCRGILLLIFALLSWDLGSGVCGRLLGYALYSAASKMANPNYSSYYVGAFSLCNNGGSFIGSILGGAVYTFFLHRYGGEKLSAVFHGYFCVCLIFMAILTAICFFYWKNQKERQ
ncbi:MAG: hypothetical protein J6S21_00610, partial [Victivallales bacterium]|nr:hypothetical protein [Victivallales bacterium]